MKTQTAKVIPIETKRKAISFISGHTIWDKAAIDAVCQELGIKSLPASVLWKNPEDAARQGLVYVNTPAGAAVNGLSYSYHLLTQLGVSTDNQMLGRGSQAGVLLGYLVKHWGLVWNKKGGCYDES